MHYYFLLVFDDFRSQFRLHHEYFTDQIDSEEEFLEENPLGIGTEREITVLKHDLPVYRTVFHRTAKQVQADDM